MKKSDLKKLALLGIAGGVILSADAANASVTDSNSTVYHLAQSRCASCGSLADNQNYGGGGGYYAPSNSCSAQPSYPQAGCGQTAYDPRQNQSYGDQQWGSGSQWTSQGGSQQQQNRGNWGGQSGYLSENQATSTRNLTENELISQLNSQGKALYQSLSPEGKALALKLANQTCSGKNECKGMNSCSGKDHSCAGKGNCAGTSPGPFQDKNQAVKVAAMKMAQKRAKMNSNY